MCSKFKNLKTGCVLFVGGTCFLNGAKSSDHFVNVLGVVYFDYDGVCMWMTLVWRLCGLKRMEA